MDYLPPLKGANSQEEPLRSLIYEMSVVVKRKPKPVSYRTFLHTQVAEILKNAMTEEKPKISKQRFYAARNSVPPFTKDINLQGIRKVITNRNNQNLETEIPHLHFSIDQPTLKASYAQGSRPHRTTIFSKVSKEKKRSISSFQR